VTAQASAPVAALPLPGGFSLAPQAPLRFSLGLVAFAFYLWIIHSYKLPAGDVAVIGLAIGLLIRGGTLRVPAPLALFLVYIAWTFTGLVVTASATISLNTSIDLLKLWVIMFCVVNLIRTAAELRFVIIAWLAVFAMYPVRGALYNQYICHCTTTGRVSWNFIFANPNDLAALSLIPLGLAAGMAYVERVRLWRWASMLGVAVLSLVVMLTQSRGAMLAIGTATAFMLVSSRRKVRDVFLLLALIGGAALLAPKAVWQRLAGLANVSVQEGMSGVDPEGSAQARWQVWEIAAETIRDHPLVGVGAGMMAPTHQRIAAQRGLEFTVRGFRDTHSTYLRIAAESGIPGLLLYLAIWRVLFMTVRRARREIAATRPRDAQMLLAIELSLVAFMVASAFGSYGSLAFTHLGISMAFLTAEILRREPWYAPQRSVQPSPAPAPRRSGAAV
jgi:O-antigen ligase